MPHVRQRLTLIVVAIAVVFVIGITGFVLIEHYPLFDAFYMTLTTITTVGYGEIRGLSQAGRIFNSFLIIIGVTIILLAIGAMTQTIIELEFSQYFGKRRIKNMIEKLQGHIILCGYGRVGRGAADELKKSGVAFVVVDHDEEKVERAIKSGMLAVLADAGRDETLKDLGIDRAKGLIATLASDADNLFVILSAKALNSRLHLSARVDEEASEDKMRRAGADFVFAPYKSTGHRMAQALIKPHVHQFIDFTTKGIGPNVGIEQVHVSAHSPLADQTLEAVHANQDWGVIVLAIRRATGEMQFNPPLAETITVGDHLIVMGEVDHLQKLEKLLAGAEK
ncbi:MAG: NAD-binding protein [Bryobacteraceae bacterium]